MTVGRMTIAVLSGLFILAFSVYFMLRPYWIIRGTARAYRRMYDGESDRNVDRELHFPLTNFLVGPMSDFLRVAPEAPWRFPRLVWFFRILGFIMTIFAFLMVSAQLVSLFSLVAK